MNAIYITSLLLLCVAIATATKVPTLASLSLEQGICEKNEVRLENQEACKGEPLGKLVSYPGNCSQFLVCNCVYPTVKICPDKLWFNPPIQTCDWPKNVPSCDDGRGTLPSTKTITTVVTNEVTRPTESTQPITPTEPCDLPPGLSVNNCQNYPDGVLQRYPYNCNAYINCTRGCSVLNYCIPGKVFNVWLMICDTPDTAHCIELNLPTTTEATTSTTEKITTSTEAITTTIEPVTHPTLPACKPLVGVSHDVCYFTEEYGVLQRYPYDCKAYINCTSGCPQLDYCEPGKVFNELLLICDTPSDEYCTEEQLPTTTVMTTVTPIATTPSPTLPPDFNNAICNDRPNGARLPYANDCGSFIVCTDKKPTLQQCPDGWLFNPELLICDEARDVNCNDGKTTLQPTTTTPIYELCINQPYGVSFPVVDNCQRYYFCWGNGTSSILSCPFENWYNPDSGNCGPEVSPVACRLTTSTTSTTPIATPSQNVCENQPASKSFPDKTNCEQYIYCLGGGGSMVMLCPPKNYYNPATGNCGPEVSNKACLEEVTTSTASPSTTTPSESTTQAPPQQGNDVCSNNSNGELVPYPGSCTKYIVCTKLAPIAFSCPNNWQFNQSTKSCDLPEHVRCGEGEVTTPAPEGNVCQGLEKGVLMPYRKNCRFYIECLGSDLWMFNSCMWGEYFDPTTHQCSANVASNACQNDVTTPPPSTDVTEPITEITTIAPKHKSPCYGKTPGELIAYPNNCTKYIVCQSPIPVGYACSAGLEFSAEQQKCVDPKEANCSIQTTITTTETTTPSGGGSTLGPDCRNSEPGATYPFRSDCSKYIICVDGLPQIVPCMPNTFYNPEKKRCDCQTSPTACFGDGDSTTVGTTTPEMTTETTESSATTDNTSKTEQTTSTANTPTTENPMGPCHGEPDGMLVPYPYNCSKYIICLSPIAVGYDCPLGQEFNSNLKQCDLPKDANCEWTTGTTVSPNTTPITTIPPGKGADCSRAENGAILPNPDDCSEYILCMNGEAVSVKCMPDTYYNPTKGACDRHTSATACKETATTVTASETTVTKTTVATPTETTSTEASTTSTETTPTSTIATTTLNPNTPNVCCGKPLGTAVAYPGECNRYISCEYPVPITVRCPDNYIFDISQLTCVPMEQGQCQN